MENITHLIDEKISNIEEIINNNKYYVDKNLISIKTENEYLIKEIKNLKNKYTNLEQNINQINTEIFKFKSN